MKYLKSINELNYNTYTSAIDKLRDKRHVGRASKIIKHIEDTHVDDVFDMYKQGVPCKAILVDVAGNVENFHASTLSSSRVVDILRIKCNFDAFNESGKREKIASPIGFIIYVSGETGELRSFTTGNDRATNRKDAIRLKKEFTNKETITKIVDHLKKIGYKNIGAAMIDGVLTSIPINDFYQDLEAIPVEGKTTKNFADYYKDWDDVFRKNVEDFRGLKDVSKINSITELKQSTYISAADKLYRRKHPDRAAEIIKHVYKSSEETYSVYNGGTVVKAVMDPFEVSIRDNRIIIATNFFELSSGRKEYIYDSIFISLYISKPTGDMKFMIVGNNLPSNRKDAVRLKRELVDKKTVSKILKFVKDSGYTNIGASMIDGALTSIPINDLYKSVVGGYPSNEEEDDDYNANDEEQDIGRLDGLKDVVRVGDIFHKDDGLEDEDEEDDGEDEDEDEDEDDEDYAYQYDNLTGEVRRAHDHGEMNIWGERNR